MAAQDRRMQEIHARELPTSFFPPLELRATKAPGLVVFFIDVNFVMLDSYHM